MPGWSLAIMSCVTTFPCWISARYGASRLHADRTSAAKTMPQALSARRLIAAVARGKNRGGCAVCKAAKCEYDNRRPCIPTGTRSEFSQRSQDHRPEGDAAAPAHPGALREERRAPPVGRGHLQAAV